MTFSKLKPIALLETKAQIFYRFHAAEVVKSIQIAI